MTQMNLYMKQKQTHRHKQTVVGRRERRLGKGWSQRLGLANLLYVGWINNKVLLYSTGNCIQYPRTNHNKKNILKECIYIYIYTHTHILLCIRSVASDSLQPHGLQYPRLPCPSPSPGICSNSCPLSQ